MVSSGGVCELCCCQVYVWFLNGAPPDKRSWREWLLVYERWRESADDFVGG